MSVPQSNAPAAPAASAPTSSSTSAPASTTSGASSGSSPASSGSSRNLTSMATSQKIDYGMGPKKEDTTQVATNSDPYGEEFWSQHGEGIFKHQRFKELTGFKKQAEEFAPVKQFVDSFGGFDELQSFHNYFGPVFRQLTGLGENATGVWNQLYPVLQAVMSGEDLNKVYSRLAGQGQLNQGQGAPVSPTPEDDDPFLQHLKPVQEELNKTKETLGQMQAREQQKQAQEYQAYQKKNVSEYEGLLDAKFADAKDPIPEGYRKFAADLIIQHIGAHMPIDRRTGKPMNPLDSVSKEAFESVWKNVVQARIKEIEGVAKSKFIKADENGGPAIPDTNSHGRATSGKFMPSSREEKSALMARRMSSM